MSITTLYRRIALLRCNHIMVTRIQHTASTQSTYTLPKPMPLCVWLTSPGGGVTLVHIIFAKDYACRECIRGVDALHGYGTQVTGTWL